MAAPTKSASWRWHSRCAGTGSSPYPTAGCRCGRSAPCHAPSECAGRYAPTGFLWPDRPLAGCASRPSSSPCGAGAAPCGRLRSRFRRQNRRFLRAPNAAKSHRSRRRTLRSTCRCRPESTRKTTPLHWDGCGRCRGCARTGLATGSGAGSGPAPVWGRPETNRPSIA